MKTRKISHREKGGSLLGEGVTGKTVNAGCRPGGNSFCKEIEGQEDTIQKIRLYLVKTSPTDITSKEEIQAFIQFVHTVKRTIAKVIKEPPPFLHTTRKALFLGELDSNRRINRLYGKKAEDYLTVAPLEYKTHDILGAEVFLSSRSPIYVLFGQKCKNRFELQSSQRLLTWVEHILKSLVILQDKKYMHNDIKPDNTVLCENTFKMIDWGFACPMDYLSFKRMDGDDMFVSPIRWYITGVPKEEAFEKLRAKTKRKEKSLFYSNVWKEFYAYLEMEVNSAISLQLTREQLFQRYKKSLDCMMIGFTIVKVVHDSSLSWVTWKPIVEALTSHTHPLSAEQALKLIQKI